MVAIEHGFKYCNETWLSIYLNGVTNVYTQSTRSRLNSHPSTIFLNLQSADITLKQDGDEVEVRVRFQTQGLLRNRAGRIIIPPEVPSAILRVSLKMCWIDFQTLHYDPHQGAGELLRLGIVFVVRITARNPIQTNPNIRWEHQTIKKLWNVKDLGFKD